VHDAHESSPEIPEHLRIEASFAAKQAGELSLWTATRLFEQRANLDRAPHRQMKAKKRPFIGNTSNQKVPG